MDTLPDFSPKLVFLYREYWRVNIGWHHAQTLLGGIGGYFPRSNIGGCWRVPRSNIVGGDWMLFPALKRYWGVLEAISHARTLLWGISNAQTLLGGISHAQT